MSDSDDGMWSAVSDFLRQIGRGFAYLFILQLSVGIAVRMILDQVAMTAAIRTGEFAASVIVIVVAMLLTNSARRPRYSQLTAFSILSLAIGLTVDGIVGFGDGHIGALYPIVQTVLIWLGAFLVAYAVTFEVEWARFIRSAADTQQSK